MTAHELYSHLQTLIKAQPETRIKSPAVKLEHELSLPLLQEALSCLQAAPADCALSPEMIRILRQVLAVRWKMIQKTRLNYTLAPDDCMNVVYIALAKKLAPLCHLSYFELLMPSLIHLRNATTYTDLSKDHIELHEFVTDDKGEHYNEIYPCLFTALNDAVLRHTSLYPNQQNELSVKELSAKEVATVTNHSAHTKALYDSVLTRLKFKTETPTFGAQLLLLIRNLRAGGAHGHRGGSEEKAGTDATNGILDFDFWFKELKGDEKQRLLQCKSQDGTQCIEKILDQIKQPLDKKGKPIRCAELLSGNIEQVLANEANEWLFNTSPGNKTAQDVSLKQLNLRVDERLEQLNQEIHSSHYKVTLEFNEQDNIELACELHVMIHDAKQLTLALKRLPKVELKVLLAQLTPKLSSLIISAQEHKLLTFEWLISLLHVLSDDKKNIVLKAAAFAIPSFIQDASKLKLLLLAIPCENYAFVMAQLNSEIPHLFSDGQQLAKFLRDIHATKHATVIYALRNYLPNTIQNAMQLFAVLKNEFAQEALLDCLESQLPCLITNGDQYIQLIAALTPALKAKVIHYFAQHNINYLENIDQLLHLYSISQACLTEIHDLQPLLMHGTNITHAFDVQTINSMLAHFDEKNGALLLTALYNSLPDKVSKGEELLSILQHCKPSNRDLLLQCMRQKIPFLIETSTQLSDICALLPQNQCQDLLNLLDDQLIRLIQNFADLLVVNQTLSPANQLLVIKKLQSRHQHLPFQKELGHWLNDHPEKKYRQLARLSHYKLWQTVNDEFDFIRAFAFLPEDARFGFMQKLRLQLPAILVSGYGLALALKYTSPALLQELDLHLCRIIQDGEQFAAVVNALPIKDLPLFFKSLNEQILKFIPDSWALAKVFDQMQKSHLPYAIDLLAEHLPCVHLNNMAELTALLTKIPQDKQRFFLEKMSGQLSNVIEYRFQVTSLCGLLRRDDARCLQEWYRNNHHGVTHRTQFQYASGNKRGNSEEGEGDRKRLRVK